MLATSPSSERWLIYALGGGLGHLNRSVAFARAAIRRRAVASSKLEICLVTNSPYAHSLPIVDELGQGHRIVQLKPTLSRDQTASRIRSLLERDRFDTLIVDTFPRGLGGELAEVIPELRCRRVLIHRNLNARYVTEYDLAAAVEKFDLLLVPGEAAPFDQHPRAVITAPWVIRDAVELLSQEASRLLLNATSNSLPVVAVIGCGKPNEVEEMRQLAHRLERSFDLRANIRFVTPRSPADQLTVSKREWTIRLWPLFQAIRGVDVLIGSGGYNTVHEARIAQRPLIAVPRARLYDQQETRLRANETAVDVESIDQKLTAALRQVSEAMGPDIPDFQNGVHQALDAL